MIPLASGSRRLADEHLRAQHAAERLTLLGQLRLPAAAPPADRALAVPHQHPRHRAQPAAAATSRRTGPRRVRVGTSTRRQPPRIAGDHVSTGSCFGGAGLPEPDRQLDRREPEIALRDLPGHIRGARGRVRRQVDRPQLPHPLAAAPSSNASSRSAPRSPSPASSETPAATPGSAAPPRPPPTPPAPARYLGGPSAAQRRPHRVLRTPQHPSDRLDRHPLSRDAAGGSQPSPPRPTSPLPPGLD